MSLPSNISKQLHDGLTALDMHRNKDALYFIDDLKNKNKTVPPDVWLALHQASKINFPPTAIYFRKANTNNNVVQLYVYDLSVKNYTEHEIALIQRSLWTGQTTPLVYFFADTYIKIINCTEPINVEYKDNFKPKYLEKKLEYELFETAEINAALNTYKADKFDTGIFWENNNIDFKKHSSLNKLLAQLRTLNNKIKNEFKEQTKNIETIQIVLIQCMLIKYLEEKNAITTKEFNLINQKCNNFKEVLEKKELIPFFEYLNNENSLNGKIFELTEIQKNFIIKNSTKIYKHLIDFFTTNLDTSSNQLSFWDEYDFKYLPVELISRIYEEFLVNDKNKDETKGIVYTPAHLARLLVDECLPISKYDDDKIDIFNFKVLDPACGSGVFLVLVYKRLVEYHFLRNRDKKGSKVSKLKITDLKNILRNIYGVDKEEQATHLTIFSLSLALCDACNPTEIFTELHFDTLKNNTIFYSDFFEWQKPKNLQFDLVIGNPPFNKIKNSNLKSKIKNDIIQIPRNEICHKFLLDTIRYLKKDGLQCLILSSASLLYSKEGNSKVFVPFLKNYNVRQIIDFTLLDSGVLWENKNPYTLALFTQNTLPNFQSNLLHLTLRKINSYKRTFYFEFDNYDMHYINRNEAIANSKYIWKCNLLGGSRIINMLDNYLLKNETIGDYATQNSIIIEEGSSYGEPILPNIALTKKGLNIKLLNQNIRDENKIKDRQIFHPPLIVLRQIIDDNRIPIYLSKDKILTFRKQITGIHSKDIGKIEFIKKYFDEYFQFITFYILTISRMYAGKENSFIKDNILNIPILYDVRFSEIENNIIDFVVNYQQEYIRHGENSIMSKNIKKDEQNSRIQDYSKGFETIINDVYKKKNFEFKLTNALVNEDYVAVTFNYTNKTKQLTIVLDKQKATIEIQKLLTNKISPSLRTNRIIFNYAKDEVTIIKPNQLRYWLPFIAYRDADIVFADLVKAGF